MFDEDVFLYWRKIAFSPCNREEGSMGQGGERERMSWFATFLVTIIKYLKKEN